ncbi:MAG: hypothetical protein LBM99_05535 [Bacillales bacterium]|jgi:hypothetical protein|nr:hypothetical protein [Bacillales bacterium]
MKKSLLSFTILLSLLLLSSCNETRQRRTYLGETLEKDGYALKLLSVDSERFTFDFKVLDENLNNKNTPFDSVRVEFNKKINYSIYVDGEETTLRNKSTMFSVIEIKLTINDMEEFMEDVIINNDDFTVWGQHFSPYTLEDFRSKVNSLNLNLEK